MKHELNMMDYLDWIEDQFLGSSMTPEEHKSLLTEQRGFLKSQPKLGDFVPTNDKGEVMEKPEEGQIKKHIEPRSFLERYEEYQSALDRVLWKGCEIHQIGDTSGNLVWSSVSCNDETIATAFKDRPIKLEPKFKTYEQLITSGIKLERIKRK